VFSTAKGDALPPTFLGRPVIDADKHDMRFIDPDNVVAGLRAKGAAKHDTSGFVVQTWWLDPPCISQGRDGWSQGHYDDCECAAKY
jgi:hypothetical protein